MTHGDIFEFAAEDWSTPEGREIAILAFLLDGPQRPDAVKQKIGGPSGEHLEKGFDIHLLVGREEISIGGDSRGMMLTITEHGEDRLRKFIERTKAAADKQDWPTEVEDGLGSVQEWIADATVAGNIGCERLRMMRKAAEILTRLIKIEGNKPMEVQK